MNLNPTQFFHVTDNPDFDINPDFAPSDVYAEQEGQPSRKGLFVTDNPHRWRSSDRSQYVAEISGASAVAEAHDDYQREWFIPAKHLGKASVSQFRAFQTPPKERGR